MARCASPLTMATPPPRQLLASLSGQDVTVIGFERQRPTLEDVFLRLVGHKDHGAAA